MKILLTGASGLVGTALAARLRERGDVIMRLVRNRKQVGELDVFWDIEKGILDGGALAGVEAVVHLAGDNVASGRWTNEKQRRILDSRVLSTRLLSHTLARVSSLPKAFISASAVGYYGNRGAQVVDEDSKPGKGFLADVCVAWEKETEVAAAVGIRTVQLRIGVVLAREGGALARMLKPFRLGLGGIIGSGDQYLSWIAIEDLVAAIMYLIDHDSAAGPVNAVAPVPVTNREFVHTLGQVLARPTMLSVPEFAIKFVLGEMGVETVLSSTRAYPRRLLQCGFNFKHKDLLETLQSLLA